MSIFMVDLGIQKIVNESLTARFYKNYKAESILNYWSQIS